MSLLRGWKPSWPRKPVQPFWLACHSRAKSSMSAGAVKVYGSLWGIMNLVLAMKTIPATPPRGSLFFIPVVSVKLKFCLPMVAFILQAKWVNWPEIIF